MNDHPLNFLAIGLGIAILCGCPCFADVGPPIPHKLIVKVRKAPFAIQSASVQSFALKGIPAPQEVHAISLFKGVGLEAQSVASDSTVVLTFGPNDDMRTIAKAYQSDPNTIYAEQVLPIQAFGNPEPLFNLQSYFSKTEVRQIESWPSRRDVVVAVIDTGIDYTHPDLVKNIVLNTGDPINGVDDDKNGYLDDYYGFNFYGFSVGRPVGNPMDYFGHGTHIAGIIAAASDNHAGIAGIAPTARIVNVCFLDNKGYGNQVDAAVAVVYAVDRGAKILNCSWGYSAYNRVLKEAFEYAIQKGVIVCAAAGNAGGTELEYPAAFEGVLGIGSIDLDKTKSYYSSMGAAVDFVSYGSGALSTVPNNEYRYKSGTSQATAVVSGIFARLLAANPLLSGADAIIIAQANTIDLGVNGRDDSYGFGAIDVAKLSMDTAWMDKPLRTAVAATPDLRSAPVSSVAPMSDLLNFPNPVLPNSGTKFGFSTDDSGAVVIKIFTLGGATCTHPHRIGGHRIRYRSLGWEWRRWHPPPKRHLPLWRHPYHCHQHAQKERKA